MCSVLGHLHHSLDRMSFVSSRADSSSSSSSAAAAPPPAPSPSTTGKFASLFDDRRGDLSRSAAHPPPRGERWIRCSFATCEEEKWISLGTVYLDGKSGREGRMCGTAVNAAHIRRNKEAVAACIYPASELVFQKNNAYGTAYEYASMEVVPAESAYQGTGVGRHGLDAADWLCDHLGIPAKEDADEGPQRAEWIGDEDFSLGEVLHDSHVLCFQPGEARLLRSEESSPCKRFARRKPHCESERASFEREKPTNDLINLLPDECLYEIFRSLSRARDRCACASVCRRWLLLQSHMPPSSFRSTGYASLPTTRAEHLSKRSVVDPKESEASLVRGVGGGEGVDGLSSANAAEMKEDEGRVERQPQWAIGDLSRRLQGRKATDIRLASIGVGTAVRGGLGKLEIRGGSGTNVGLSAIGLCCGALRRLSLWQCPQIGDEGLISIGRGCRLLEKLHLMKCPGIGDAGIRALAEGCPLLSTIDLDSCSRIGDAGLMAIGRSCSGLVSLSVSNCDVGSVGIVAVVTGCSKLRKMKLDKVRIDDAGFASLGEICKSLVKLRLLRLRNVSEAGFLHLGETSSMKELRVMCVTDCRGLSDRALEVVGSCRDLKVFSLMVCESVSDAGLMAFTRACVSLKSLVVEGCNGITHAGLRAALSTRGGSLETLSLRNCNQVRDEGLASPDFQVICNALKCLSITHCVGVGNGCLGMVGRSCPSLEQLDLSGLTNVSDRGLKALILGTRGKIQSLNLSGCVKITDCGVTAVARHCAGSLKHLTLEGCSKVTDRSLEVIATECCGIEDLDVSKCAVTDQGLMCFLASNGKYLKSLSLSGCKLITDKSLRAIGDACDVLWALNLKQCEGLSTEALDDFESRLYHIDLFRS